MKKGRKYIASLLAIGGLAGVNLYSNEQINVSAHGNQEQSQNTDRNEDDETMWGHMETMHGGSYRNRENSSPDEDDVENNTDQSEDDETDSWNDWHNRMWEFRDENIDDSSDDRESFFGDMRNHMRGFNDFSFNGMFDWMGEMHRSFNFNRGMMDWNERELDDNEGREFMERLNFFNSK